MIIHLQSKNKSILILYKKKKITVQQIQPIRSKSFHAKYLVKIKIIIKEEVKNNLEKYVSIIE